MSTDDQLFERLGGAEGLQSLVEAMYARVFADPKLAPFFKHTSVERLHRMQFQFLASALDGPVEYTGAELGAIHTGRGVTGAHFAAFCGHFADTLEAAGIAGADVDSCLGRLATYKDKVTGEGNVDG